MYRAKAVQGALTPPKLAAFALQIFGSISLWGGAMSNWAYPQKVSDGKKIRSVALACWACDPAHSAAITTRREIRFINPSAPRNLIPESKSQLKFQNPAALYMRLRSAHERNDFAVASTKNHIEGM
jgi:hypothetical protein